jgi:hypothetical protein
MVPSGYSPRANPEFGDSRSECTQISLETVSLEWDQGERATGEEPSPDTGSALGIADPAAQRRRSSEAVILSEENRPSRSEEFETFLDGLKRARVEQEELEKRMESERFDQELNLLYYNQASPGELLQQDYRGKATRRCEFGRRDASLSARSRQKQNSLDASYRYFEN